MLYQKGMRLLAAVFAVMTFFAFASCDSNGAGGGAGGGTGTGSLTVGGQTYSLSKMYTIDYGLVSAGVYNIDIALVSDGLTLNRDTGFGSGIGEIVYLELFFPTPSISAGTFIFSDVSDPPANSFSDWSDIEVRWQPALDISDGWWELAGGVVTISISGSTYSINGNVDLDDESTATFNYSGPITGAFDER